jgi:hypothetical protein
MSCTPQTINGALKIRRVPGNQESSASSYSETYTIPKSAAHPTAATPSFISTTKIRGSGMSQDPSTIRVVLPIPRERSDLLTEVGCKPKLSTV